MFVFMCTALKVLAIDTIKNKLVIMVMPLFISK